ncbi:PKD domain-containing protein [Svornostia abyssi]|uniref:PKD domain-containing protein n=1 Tax=Svornostia abyssi TaxID=2898438 RepID=A0ABY5PLZ2_9ACTN|nr:PKD domain-containing protein [Parviterribacteraceae bacterium J379]
MARRSPCGSPPTARATRTGDALSFRWTFGDGSPASTAAAPEHVYTAPGTYTATLTVDDGRGATATDTVRVTVGNDPPEPRIVTPASGATFRGGEVIDLQGAATDPETGDLPAEALSWRVTLHHAGHTHPIVQVTGANEARFRAVQDHDADSWYEIELTATDPGGVAAKRTVELRPETVPLRVESAPAGAPVTYAGRARTAPYAQDAAVGFRTSVSAAERFVKDGRLWEFSGWSDDGARLHDLTIPSTALTLTATYRDAGPATGALRATAASTAFGDVAAGATASRTVTLRNTGSRDVTITGSTPPGGQFALETPLATGTVVPPGGEVVRAVRFTATELGEVQARWRVTADDGSVVSADLTAAGIVPGVAADGWRRNGVAKVVGGALELTPAARDQRGTAFWPAPVDARRLDVSFDALLTGGTGADGLALVLADPARGATAGSLGAGGAGLGFSSIPGWAAALVTWKNNGVTAPFAGVSDGPTPGKPGLPRWVATTRDVPPLRTATPSRVRVQVIDGVLRLSINGVQRLTTPVALPDRVLVGFSGSTGGSTDRHVVSNASIGGAPGPALPPPDGGGGGDPGPDPPSLRVVSTVIAPPGSPEESTAIRLAGRCPSTLAAFSLAAGASATPVLGGAAAGATCVLEQDAITGDGWSTTATVNDGAPVALTLENGVVRVPAFALQAGVNTVVLTNRYQPPAPGPDIPDPASGGWQLNGAASITGGGLQLTPASADVKGSGFWPETVKTDGLVVEFDATVDGGTGADGMALVLGDPSRGATPSSLGGGGGSLGFGGIPGWGVALASYPNGTQATGNFVGLSDGALTGAWQTLSWLQTSSLLTPLQNTTRRVRLAIAAGVVTVSLDGAPVISRAVALPERVLLGFSAGTGGLTNRHTVRNVVVSGAGSPPPPPAAASLRIRSTIVAPAGTPEASTSVTVTGACPSAFTGTVGAGQSVTPALTGGVQGAACNVAQTVPGAGWTATVSVNGGAAQPVTAAGGVYPVPAFTLSAGENTVAFTSTYTPPAPPPPGGVPDPAVGGWQLNGVASMTGGALQLTPASADVKGSGFWPETVKVDGLVVEFDASVDGGTGADGMALVLGDPSRGATPSSLGGGGGSLGFGGIPGWGVALASYPNGTQATGNFVGLSDGALAGAWQTLSWLQTSSLLTPLQNTTRRVRVAITAGVVTVSLDGAPVISRAVALPERVLLGFSAGTGGLTNRHTVRNVVVTTG